MYGATDDKDTIKYEEDETLNVHKDINTDLIVNEKNDNNTGRTRDVACQTYSTGDILSAVTIEDE